jgi:hypothetical protein
VARDLARRVRDEVTPRHRLEVIAQLGFGDAERLHVLDDDAVVEHERRAARS